MSRLLTPRPNIYTLEVGEWIVRRAIEHHVDFASKWAAIKPVFSKLNMTYEALRAKVRRAQFNDGLRRACPLSKPLDF